VFEFSEICLIVYQKIKKFTRSRVKLVKIGVTFGNLFEFSEKLKNLTFLVHFREKFDTFPVKNSDDLFLVVYPKI